MALSLTDLRRRRGVARGNITKTQNQVRELQGKDLARIDSAQIKRIYEGLSKQNDKYDEHHQAMLDTSELADENQHDEEYQDKETTLNEVQQDLADLGGIIEAFVMLRMLESALESIELDAEDGFSTASDAELDQARATSKALDAIRAKGSVSRHVDLTGARTVAIKKLKALQRRRDAEKAPVPILPTATAAAPAAEHMSTYTQGLTIAIPEFDGSVLSWKDFIDTFQSIMAQQPHLKDPSKKCHFLGAMGTEACKTVAKNIFSFENNFDKAIILMREKYEDKRVLHMYHYSAYFQPETMDNRKQDMDDFVIKSRTAIRGFKEASATTLEQAMTLHGQKSMTPQLLTTWKKYSKKSEITPPIQELLKFLEEQSKAVGNDDISLEPLPQEKPSQHRHERQERSERHRPKPKTATRNVHHIQRDASKCILCEGDHKLAWCPKYKEKTATQKQEYVKTTRACYNCLSTNHRVSECTSEGRCRTCNGKHHSSIHLPKRTTSNGHESEREVAIANLVQRDLSSKRDNKKSLPCTATMIVAANGLTQQARAQLDPGAEVSLISHKLAVALKAPRMPHSTLCLGGVGGTINSPYAVQVTLIGREGEEVMIEPQVVEKVPRQTTEANAEHIRQLPFVKDLDLADPRYTTGAAIDIILDNTSTNTCTKEGVRFSEAPGLKAENTIFGWTVSGSDFPTDTKPTNTRMMMHITRKEAEDPVQIFRDMIELEQDLCLDTQLTSEEERAIEHFGYTVTRDDDGRYRVSLPRKEPTPELGQSRECAVRRYNSNKKSLERQGKWQNFRVAVENYEELGHSETVPERDMAKPVNETFYLPMHSVVKQSSTTTKLRVVFDASAKSSTGHSLNDTLLPGPSFYPLLTSILTKFRSHKVAVSADISMMFREIGLNPEEADYHRYVHINQNGVMEDKRMTRLTFGVTSSPFEATMVLRRLAQDYRQEYPTAARLIDEDFYVDDCLSGADTVEEAAQIVDELNALTRKGCMTTRKWRSSSAELLQTIPEELRETADLQLSSPPSTCSKALGVHWSNERDCLHIATPEIDSAIPATKRRVASAIAKIFDVLGWFCPATLPAKIILQNTWALNLGWDDELPPEMQEKWKVWIAELPAITQHPIPRYLGLKERRIQSRQLHGFADASLEAYGGVVYQRTLYQNGDVSVDQVVAKTRVSPTKCSTVPRLELCGALVLAKLLKQVMTDLKITQESTFAWSDSAVVIGWLRKHPGKLVTYVANRVGQIRDRLENTRWQYIDTKQNPADILSRGMPAKELTISRLWWKGPPWLSKPQELWPKRKDIDGEAPLEETRRTILRIAAEPKEFGSWSSSFGRIVRVRAWMDRFCTNGRARSRVIIPYITAKEYRTAKTKVLKQSQKLYFEREYKLLEGGSTLSKSHSISSLAPFLDKDGLIRVGGRLQKASISAQATHPIILNTKSRIVTLMIEQTHKTLLHAGPSTMMATLATNFHIPRLRRTLRKISRNCVGCQRAYARTSHQFMGELPETRVQPARAFSIVGVDYAGPFTIRKGKTRSPNYVKSYVCLFICFVTKAIHLELVTDATTEGFLAALGRFVDRRGFPAQIYSDNGSNFVGAEAELRKMTSILRTEETKKMTEHWTADRDIQWNFSPARSPHFGGIWEAAVGSMKRILRKTVGDTKMRYEELNSVIIAAEAILNSRPLVPLDSPTDDAVAPLTPGHFLVGAPLSALPARPDEVTKITTLRRWNLVQRLQQELWKRWREEYLLLLQKRNKWRTPGLKFQIGDVVLIKDVDAFQRVWPIGRITDVFPGRDGIVRVAEVWSKQKTWKRATHRLVHLLAEEDEVSARGEDVEAPREENGDAVEEAPREEGADAMEH